MAVEFDAKRKKILLNGKCVGGIDYGGGRMVAWFSSASVAVRFTEDFTADDLRAIADKLEELNALEEER